MRSLSLTVLADGAQTTRIARNATDVLLIDSLSESIKLAFQNAWVIAEMLRLLLDKQVDLWGQTAERIAA